MSARQHTPSVIIRLSLAIMLLLTLATANLRFLCSLNYIDWQFNRLQVARAIHPDWPTTEAARPIIEYLDHQHDVLPGLTPKEQAHLADVRAILDLSRRFTLASLVLFSALLALIKTSGAWRQLPRHLIFAIIFATALVAGLLLALQLDFNLIFNQFHTLFFADGTWSYTRDSTLIRLFPPVFWEGAARDWAIMTLIEVILVGSAIASIVHFRLRSSPRRLN